jgi:GNAT superfamily N-acetyltransferase
MPEENIVIREAIAADMPGMTHVRTSVSENLLTREQLDERGLSDKSLAASLLKDRKGWVAEHDGEIVAFSMADAKEGAIFALFVLPAYEGRGLGSRLLELALGWLWEGGEERVWLTTAPGTRAAGFYRRRGWICVGTASRGDQRFELVRRPSAEAGRPQKRGVKSGKGT